MLTTRPAAGAARGDVALALLIVGALLFAFRDALAALLNTWSTSPMYSYGYSVPFVTAFLLWSCRDRLRQLTPRPAYLAGLATLLAAAALLIAGRAGGVRVLEQVAFLVAIAACVLVTLGASYLRVSWAALAYLLLMVPIWDVFTEPLHQPFQLRSAAMGLKVLQLLGIPAHGEGTMLMLPGLTLEVARACSGVNYLVAVIALGLPLAYLYLPGFWRRALLLVVSVTVAALSNGLRVALIGVLAHYQFSSALHGPGHMLHGLFVAAIGYVALFVGLALLTPKATRKAATPPPSAAANNVDLRPAAYRQRSAAGGVVLVAVFMLLGSNTLVRAAHPVALPADLRSFPIELGGWVAAVSSPSSQASALWPGADHQLARTYRRADGSGVDVYIGYFAVQRQNKQIISFRTSALHTDSTVLQLDRAALRVNYSQAGIAGRPTMFWYSFDDGPQASRYVVKAQTLWRAFWSGRSNGAVVVLSIPTSGSTSEESLRELAPLVEQALRARLLGESAAKL